MKKYKKQIMLWMLYVLIGAFVILVTHFASIKYGKGG